ncbi:MAG: YkgJ family cysteine cluster protein, partial [Epsilonproteobacteria bacterium]|nr:YkgJ family cysteine cluster protein [Campylobacterota bacterium]
MAELMRCNAYPYAFDPSACETCQGNCCIGESGYIWVSAE